MADELAATQPDLFSDPLPTFNGPAYVPEFDRERLTGQLLRVFQALTAASFLGEWLTLGEIRARTGDPEASISAQLRHLRKPRFGSHTVEKRRRGEEGRGLWEYRMGNGDA
jgi:hypothetical protein